MRIYKTEAVILKRLNYGEADRILTIFSKHYGKITVIAKGVRKIISKRGPNIESFNQVELSLYTGKNLDGVSEVKTINSFSNIRRNLKNVESAFQMCELVDLLTRDRQESRGIFSLLIKYFTKLNLDGKINLQEFKVDLLTSLGFLSEEESLNQEIDDYIESLAERRIKTKNIYE